LSQLLKNNHILKNFEELGISKDLVKGITELNIIKPTEIQRKVIPVLLKENVDFIGQANTGTGKTAAYGLPLLQKIDPGKEKVQALILCPTRELSQQVAKQLFRFTKYSAKIFTEAVYGGEYIDKQISSLKRPTHIVVATPGRLIDLVKRKAVNLDSVKTVILDEADEMLSMGFKLELEEILSFVYSAKEKWLFSATMPHGINEIIKQYMSADAIHIKESNRDIVNKKITHQYMIVDEKAKLNTLLQFLKSEGENRGLIFCRTKAATKKLTKQLIAKNVATDAIHGDLLQKERDKVMRAFKNKKLQFLVATDVAARGIDIEALAFVVHYQLPESNDYYTHRSGRTARAGKEGISLCLINTSELKNLKKYERNLKIQFNQVK